MKREEREEREETRRKIKYGFAGFQKHKPPFSARFAFFAFQKTRPCFLPRT